MYRTNDRLAHSYTIDNAAPTYVKAKKLYIPISSNPEIHFPGLLIGPKGSTQRYLMDLTGAKLTIRGKSFYKDGRPSNTGHPDDNDELHVSIEGTEDAVDKAYREIGKILFNPDELQRLRDQQQSSSGSNKRPKYDHHHSGSR